MGFSRVPAQMERGCCGVLPPPAFLVGVSFPIHIQTSLVRNRNCT